MEEKVYVRQPGAAKFPIVYTGACGSDPVPAIQKEGSSKWDLVYKEGIYHMADIHQHPFLCFFSSHTQSKYNLAPIDSFFSQCIIICRFDVDQQ